VFTAHFHTVKKVISGSFKCKTAWEKTSYTSAPEETKHSINFRIQNTREITVKIQNAQILFHINNKTHSFFLHLQDLQRS